MEAFDSIENETSMIVREAIGDWLVLIDRFFQFGYKISDARVTNTGDVPKVCFVSALGIHVKSCRLLRAAGILIGRAMAGEAETLSRSLFESALVQAFVSRKDFQILTSKGSLASVPESIPPRLIRGALVQAHSELRAIEWAKQAAPTQEVATAAEKAWEDRLEVWLPHLGTNWCDLLVKSNTPAGVSISALAKSCGGDIWTLYNQVYGYQSAFVHPAMIHRYATPHDLPTQSTVHWNDQLPFLTWAAEVVVESFLHELQEFLQLLILPTHLSDEFSQLSTDHQFHLANMKPTSS